MVSIMSNFSASYSGVNWLVINVVMSFLSGGKGEAMRYTKQGIYIE